MYNSETTTIIRGIVRHFKEGLFVGSSRKKGLGLFRERNDRNACKRVKSATAEKCQYLTTIYSSYVTLKLSVYRYFSHRILGLRRGLKLDNAGAIIVI